MPHDSKGNPNKITSAFRVSSPLKTHNNNNKRNKQERVNDNQSSARAQQERQQEKYTYDEEEVGSYLPSSLVICERNTEEPKNSVAPAAAAVVPAQRKVSWYKKKRRSVSSSVASTKALLVGKLLNRHGKRLHSLSHATSRVESNPSPPSSSPKKTLKESLLLTIEPSGQIVASTDIDDIEVVKVIDDQKQVSVSAIAPCGKSTQLPQEDSPHDNKHVRQTQSSASSSGTTRDDTSDDDEKQSQSSTLSNSFLVVPSPPEAFLPMDPTTAGSTVLMMAQGGAITKPPTLKVQRGEETDSSVTNVASVLVYVVTLGVGGLALVTAFVATGGFVEIACCCLTSLFCGATIYQKHQLSGLKTLRRLHNELRAKVNRFIEENNQLHISVDRLEGSVTKLEKVESDLKKLTNTNNLNRLVYCVKETKRINAQIKKNIKARIIQDLITTVLRSDNEGDLQVGPNEMNRLMFRMKSMKGFHFQKEIFLKLLGPNTQESYSLLQIMKVLKNLMNDDIPDKENAFVLLPDKKLV